MMYVRLAELISPLCLKGYIKAYNDNLDNAREYGLYETEQCLGENNGKGVNDHGILFVFEKGTATVQLLLNIRGELFFRYHTSSGTDWGSWKELTFI